MDGDSAEASSSAGGAAAGGGSSGSSKVKARDPTRFGVRWSTRKSATPAFYPGQLTGDAATRAVCTYVKTEREG